VDSDDTDEALMERIAEGDRGAFHTLTRRHLPRVLRIATRVLGNASEAEDVAQEAFLRVWSHADRWDAGKAKVTTWMHRIVVNLCIDRRRKARNVPLDEAGDPADPAPGAADELWRSQMAGLVNQAIGELPERQRAALVLSYYEEMSNVEAAQALSVSVSALESLLVRARRTVRDRLAALGLKAGVEE
jgi:RNA polymerase sigma-70 factor (ECF subfamily)